MKANLQDAELTAMDDNHSTNLAAHEDPVVERPQRGSPSSSVCYMNFDAPSVFNTAASQTIEQRPSPAPARRDNAVSPAPVENPEGQMAEESDSTPRSEVPSVPGTVNEPDSEPSYFSPLPLRVLPKNIPHTHASTDTSPTTSEGPSSSNHPEPQLLERTSNPSLAPTQPLPPPLPPPPPPVEQTDNRPVWPQKDVRSNSTTGVAAVRTNSLDALHTSTPSSKQRDGPHYPNQSYAALQTQQYPAPHIPHMLRAKRSHPANHSSGYSVSHISTFGLSGDHYRDIIESGSRTVGNSPASSPGLFSPTTPPLRHSQQSDDNLYSAPWLHYTHRQAPKETHVADIDVDPISGRKLVNHYEVIDELGRGVHGKVKLGRNLETNEHVAIKIVDRFSKRRRLGKNTSHEDKIKREIAILKKARHPNIVGLLEVIDDPSKKKVYIVLELVELGEVKWRAEGAKEVCRVEWRRYQRESEGIFDNESAALEDEKIIRLAHEKLERQQRRRAKERQQHRPGHHGKEPWSLEFGGDSEAEYSDNDGISSRASTHGDHAPSNRLSYADRRGSIAVAVNQGTNMETAFRSSTPTATVRPEDASLAADLEGTMYGAYDTELFRGRTPSLAGSSSSHFTDGEEEVPEHFRYVPMMPFSQIRDTFRDTVLGLEYLHYQGVIHRDIKPANLLVTENRRVKISDFGVSYLGRRPTTESSGDQSESDVQDVDDAIELAKTVGTPAFYAPELCHTELDFDSPRIDSKIDIWALGVTLYCLIYGRVPFHDHNQWLLMRHITDDEPYIPRYRLKPVAKQNGSRPNSHGRSYYSMTSNERAPHDLEYEEVDEDLRDLLQKMFIKDPRKRISIPEIKRHSWLTRDIENLNSWVEETDPDKSSHGRKIEISKDDIQNAVVPFNTLMDRVRFGFRKVGEVARSLTRRESRRRAQSNTSGQDTPHRGSANSSSSTISQEGRRPSLGPGMSFFEALSKSREPEHPLSQSVTASPEANERPRYFESPNSRTASPAHSTEGREHLAPFGSANRPHLQDRAYSGLSSAGSVRTVRQSDLPSRIRPVSPGVPLSLDTSGGMPKRIVHEARSDERMLRLPRGHSRAKSIDPLVNNSPSLAMSTAVASGRVNHPDIAKELTSTIARSVSPNLSDYRPPGPTEMASSRQSSVSSVSSRPHKSWAVHGHKLDAAPSLESPPPSAHTTLARNISDERFSRAKDEFSRRQAREENLSRPRPVSATYQRVTSALSQTASPPSPGEETSQRQKIEDYLNQQRRPSHDTSPINYPIMTSTQPRTPTSSSSEDQFTSMSQSTSNPSIPSVASATSSVAPDDCSQMNSLPRMVPAASGDSIHLNQFDVPTDDPAGYDGDHVVESEDEESDEEDFLVMGKRKPTPSAGSGSISNAELARSTIRKEISSRRRSARSGSNGTVKKIPPPENASDSKPSETQ